MHVFFFVFITSQLCLKELAKIVKSIVHLNQRAFSGGKGGPQGTACGVKVPWPETEPKPSAAEAQSPNHWTPGKSLQRALASNNELRQNVSTVSQLAQVVKIGLPVQETGDAGSIPGSERSPEEGKGSPRQCSRLENPMDRGAWRDTIHGVTQSRTQLSN